MRVGIGADFHRFGHGSSLVLGGVAIDWPQGLRGHSDADVLTHAVIDALLGAAALGDIGGHFPDTDERYTNVRSMELLREVCVMIADKGWFVGNIDSVVVAEAPRLAPYLDEMRSGLAEVCGISTEAVSVKATTSEGMGFTGRGEGIEARAVALITRSTGMGDKDAC